MPGKTLQKTGQEKVHNRRGDGRQVKVQPDDKTEGQDKRQDT